MKIHLENKIVNDNWTKYVYDNYDIQNQEKTEFKVEFNIDLDFDWQIGVIYGPSGTGKTSILKQLGYITYPDWNNEKAVISNFDFMEPAEATELLVGIGLSSVPTWLRPYNKLSNGEQYRAMMAMILAKTRDHHIALVDEYTSVVDRDVAKSMSVALQKYVRRTKKKIVLGSCHFDIMEWLCPDWIYSPLKGAVERRSLRQRPAVELQIYRCRPKAWNIFKHHHYLTEEINAASRMYMCFWNEKPVGFMAILPFPGVGDKLTRRVSRLVVLPDFQGLGLGKKFLNYISSLYAKERSMMYIRSINPAIGKALSNDSNWKPTMSNMKAKFAEDTSGRKLLNKVGYSFKYVGAPSEDDTSIIKFSEEAYANYSQNQIALFN